jgi:hypothetical protein
MRRKKVDNEEQQKENHSATRPIDDHKLNTK